MRADIIRAEELARRLLLEQNPAILPVRVRRLRLPGSIAIDSIQNFCRVTNTSLEQLCAGSGCLRDGCTFVRWKDGQKHCLILYNADEKNGRRLNFTLAHEVGHILLEHSRDGDLEEREANAFASELLMPRVLVRRLAAVTGGQAEEVAGFFGTSLSAARIKLADLCRPGVGSETLLLGRYSALLPDLKGPVVY